MGEIIARCACPVCGAANQNLKINKRGNLYIYCDNRCATRFSPKDSREILDGVRAGHPVVRGNAIYTPLNNNFDEKTMKGDKNNDGKFTGNTDRSSVDGRSNRKHTGSNTAPRVERLASWLWSDDDGI